jgi:flagellar biogenesis protein FliO
MKGIQRDMLNIIIGMIVFILFITIVILVFTKLSSNVSWFGLG